ncbi:MAG: ATP-dependent DNA helicase [Kangiellaceae bacterium]|nr:ATP-dependent DNA helicase [Kangiellaceae bacterium]
MSQLNKEDSPELTTMERDRPTFRVAVRDLVDFCCRQGDLSIFSESGPTKEEGIRGHQYVQRKRSEDYQSYFSEVALYKLFKFSDCCVELRGRADGLFIFDEDDMLTDQSSKQNLFDSGYSELTEQELFVISNSSLTIEEIKTCYVPPDKLSLSQTSAQKAQARVYATLLAESSKHKEVTIQQTWLKLPEYKIIEQSENINMTESKLWLATIVERYASWLLQHYRHRLQTRKAIKSAPFPHSRYRSNQKYLSQQAYYAIKSSSKLMVQAPTGIGKTISLLFPSAKAYGEGILNQIVFLTAKTTGRQAALDACAAINATLSADNTNRLKVLVINAKELVCFCNNDLDSNSLCGYKTGYYEKLPDAMSEAFNESVLDRSAIECIADKYRICPFSFSLAMIPWVDIVIADYNYVFDPLVKFSHFEDNAKCTVVLIDEAHNLIDRSRGMYSAIIEESDALKMYDLYKNTKKRSLLKSCQDLQEGLLSIRSQLSKDIGSVDIDVITKPINVLVSLIMERGQSEELTSEELAWLKQLIRFKVVSELINQHYLWQGDNVSNNLLDSYRLNLYCLNAFEHMNDLIKPFGSMIFFSATLSPEPYIRNTLGIENAPPLLTIPTPFSSSQAKFLVDTNINLTFNYRDQAVPRIAKTIFELRRRHGNYLICFSSYSFLQKVYLHYRREYCDEKIFHETRGDSHEQRKNNIDNMFEEAGWLGFVIMGSSYTEGIDYKGDALHGVVIVGAGLPQVSEKQNAIKSDFDEMALAGFEMAYTYPAMQRVLQTAGRVIRSENDRGVILLLDQRFARSPYRELLADAWYAEYYAEVKELRNHLADFWRD